MIVPTPTQFLTNLKGLRFSGQLVQMDPSGQRWTFYLSKGSIIHATGGVHLMRRWQRNLTTYCPRIPNYRIAWQRDLASIDEPTFPMGWEYALLQLWVSQQKITLEQATQMIDASITEVLFDVAQASDVAEQIRQDNSLSPQLPLFEVEPAIQKAQKQWQIWQQAKLADYSPNLAPVLKQPEQLQRYSSTQFYKNLVTLLNGEHTLRDLAVKTQRGTVEITSSILPFIQLGWLELLPLADLPAPIYRRKPSASIATPTPPPAKRGLIACVDDSSLVLQMMEKLVTSAGYEFLGIDDAIRALGSLLTRKPDLIFLDLVMPKGNGYEICEQLRKLAYFRKTPIVILTGNDGYANRLRSNFVGASDFLSKPLDADAVLNVIKKHLEPSAASSSAPNERHQGQDSLSRAAKLNASY